MATDNHAVRSFDELFRQIDMETPPSAYPTRDDVVLELGTALGLLSAAQCLDRLDPRTIQYAPGVAGRIKNAVRCLLGRDYHVVASREQFEAAAPEDLNGVIADLEERVDELAEELHERPAPERRLKRVERGIDEMSAADDAMSGEEFLKKLERAGGG